MLRHFHKGLQFAINYPQSTLHLTHARLLKNSLVFFKEKQ